MPPIQDALETTIAVKKEAAWGDAIPEAGAGGTAKYVQVLEGGLSLSKQLDETEEIRSDRADTGEGTLTQIGQGSINALLRPFGVTDALAYLFEGAFMSTWSTDASSAVVGSTTTTISVTPGDGSKFKAGMVVKVASGANIGVHLIESVATDTLTIAGGGLTAGQTSGAIASANLTTGTTDVSLLLERSFPSVAADAKFQQANGVRVGSIGLNVSQGAQIACNFDLQGKGIARSSATVFETITAAPATRHYEASSHVPGIYYNGTALSGTHGGIVKSCNMSLQNALRPEYGVGSPIAQAIQPGVFRANGSLECYFMEEALLDALLASDAAPLTVFHRSSDRLQGFAITYPRTFLSSGGPTPTRARSSVMQTVAFKAVLGVTDAVCGRISIGV